MVAIALASPSVQAAVTGFGGVPGSMRFHKPSFIRTIFTLNDHERKFRLLSRVTPTLEKSIFAFHETSRFLRVSHEFTITFRVTLLFPNFPAVPVVAHNLLQGLKRGGIRTYSE
uniref:(northern house mosquito) hypothetical protein n=1 Tax=Culex pipiens TaxID=7175 RepID=A0A8D8C4J7_CULPI